MSNDECPLCGADLRGEPIPADVLSHYASDATHYSRRIGVELPWVYDGVAYWLCPDCGGTWDRFPADSERGRRIAAARAGMPV